MQHTPHKHKHRVVDAAKKHVQRIYLCVGFHLNSLSVFSLCTWSVFGKQYRCTLSAFQCFGISTFVLSHTAFDLHILHAAQSTINAPTAENYYSMITINVRQSQYCVVQLPNKFSVEHVAVVTYTQLVACCMSRKLNVSFHFVHVARHMKHHKQFKQLFECSNAQNEWAVLSVLATARLNRRMIQLFLLFFISEQVFHKCVHLWEQKKNKVLWIASSWSGLQLLVWTNNAISTQRKW